MRKAYSWSPASRSGAGPGAASASRNGERVVMTRTCASGGRAAWGFLRRAGALTVGELPAGRGDVPAPVLADERGDMTPGEDLPELLGTILAGGEEAEARVLVVGDEVHLRRDVAEQLDQ